jgi:hypothetical protein
MILVDTAVTAGDSVIVVVDSVGGGPVTVKDSANNVYSQDVVQNGLAIFSSHNVKTILAGGSITVSESPALPLIVSASEFSGLAATNTLDQTKSANTGSSIAPSSGFTGTTTQPNELLIGAISDHVGTAPVPAFTTGAGYTGLPGQYFDLTDAVNPEFQIVAATGTYQANATLSAAPDGSVAAIATYIGAAPPTISQAFGAPSIPLNGTTTLTFTVSNPNPGTPLTGIGFTDTLPTGLVIATPNGLSGNVGGGTITATAGGSSISLTGATLAAGASGSFSINVAGTSPGTKSNTTSTIGSNQATGNPATASIMVVPAPPTLSQAFGAASIPLNVNGATMLTFTVSNPNSSGTLTGIGFTDSLPSGLVIATPNGVTGSVAGGTISATAGGGSVSLTGARLAAGASGSFSINVAGTSLGTKTNTTSTISSTEGGAGNAATAGIQVVAAVPTVTSISPTSGAATGGTSLTITGTNFTGATAVMFGNTAATSFTVNSATSITAVSPAGTGTVDLTVTTFGGTSATAAADQFTFTNPPPPPPTPPPPPATVPRPFVSLGFTTDGQEVVEAVSSSGVLTQFDATGNHQLATGARSASVAFGPQGEIMDVVFQDGELIQFDVYGTHQLTTGVLSASVAIVSGQEVLEVVALDGTLKQYDGAGIHQLATGVRSASVAFGSVGEVLDVVFADGRLFQFDASGAHQLGLNSSSGVVKAAGIALVPSAAAGLLPGSPAQEVLDAMFADGSLWQFDATGGHMLGTV